jgi:uncharacterized protein
MQIKMTPTMGRGVFATRAVAQGETLGEFHTLRIPPDEVATMRRTLPGEGLLSRFWFEDDADGSAFVALGWIELVNHSLSPNVDRSWHDSPEGDVVTLFALRDIQAGEQVFIDYRFDADRSKPEWG